MHVLSIFRKAVPIRQRFCNLGLAYGLQLRNGHERRMIITPSRWQWHKFKDLFHFYIMLGFIPLSAIVFFVNVFIGPAQLAEIPEGYYPEKWEYYKHPVSRFMAKYVYPSHQEEYEKFLQFIFEEDEKTQMRKIQKNVNDLMYYRGDSQHYVYYSAPNVEYLHRVRKDFDEKREYQGVPYSSVE